MSSASHSSGTEALDGPRSLTPDVVLVDLDLDGESGFDVAVELARSVSVPVIILISTHSLEDFQELVAGSPARGFLPKSALSARAIRELLEQRGGARLTERSRTAVPAGSARQRSASGVVGTWSTRFNAGELGALNDGVRM